MHLERKTIRNERKRTRKTNKSKNNRKRITHKRLQNICGIDEAGRGPLAGPVVVAGVIMPADSMIEGVNDSKKSQKKREKNYMI